MRFAALLLIWIAQFAIATIAPIASAAEIRVMVSGDFSATYRALTPAFEKETRYTLTTFSGPAMGGAVEAIPNRLLHGEKADVIIMASTALDELIKQGKVMQGSRVDFATSKVGMAVQSGSARPNISTVADLKRTLLNARSIAYSDNASGIYLTTFLFPHLGIAEQMKGKASMIPGEPVGAVVARGGAELGIQQVNELLPILGIEFLGPLPDAVQKVTVFSAGIPTNAPSPLAGKVLIDYLAGPSAATALVRSGMEPMPARR